LSTPQDWLIGSKMSLGAPCWRSQAFHRHAGSLSRDVSEVLACQMSHRIMANAAGRGLLMVGLFTFEVLEKVRSGRIEASGVDSVDHANALTLGICIRFDAAELFKSNEVPGNGPVIGVKKPTDLSRRSSVGVLPKVAENFGPQRSHAKKFDHFSCPLGGQWGWVDIFRHTLILSNCRHPTHHCIFKWYSQ